MVQWQFFHVFSVPAIHMSPWCYSPCSSNCSQLFRVFRAMKIMTSMGTWEHSPSYSPCSSNLYIDRWLTYHIHRIQPVKSGPKNPKKSSATVRPPWDLRWCPKCRPAQHIVPASAPWCVAPLHHRSPCLGQTPGPRGSSPGRPRKGMAGESEKSEGI